MGLFAAFLGLSCLAAAAAASRQIPEDLLMGFATASYQIEGGWDKDGKGENVWDRFTHTQNERIDDGSTGDVACDSYHQYKKDVQLIKDIGGQVYRFSLSWSRILPTGFPNKINQKGIQYYNDLIDELLKNDIEPMVTLFHWDLPQPLQDLGGWANPKMADCFKDFARVAFSAFGDRVKKWITFNEPVETCKDAYGGKGLAPAVNMPGIAEYWAGDTVLKAHARAYHLYDDEFRPTQKGVIGLTLSVNWLEPKSSSAADQAASEDGMQFSVGWLANPIFSKEGDYPEVMKRNIAQRSLAEGFTETRLPALDDSWVNYIKGTSDYFGLNHYTSRLVTYGAVSATDGQPSWLQDLSVVMTVDGSWQDAGPSWLKMVPWGLRRALNWVRTHYDNPVVFIAENGCGDYNGVEDDTRVRYYQSYLTEMLKAVQEDGCRVQVYTAWTLLDNFEWLNGYREKFGIHQVDFNDPERKRTPKKSAKFFKHIIKHRVVPDNIEDITYKDEL